MSTLVVVGYDHRDKSEEVRITPRAAKRIPDMKRISIFLIGLVSVALVAGSTGCATSKDKEAAQQKEDILQAAGFKVIPAATPEQQQLVKTLPNDRVSALRRKGQVYFVFPVRSRDAFYVGNNSQYLTYQQAAQVSKKDLVEQEIESINRSMSSPGWEAPWGEWDTQ